MIFLGTFVFGVLVGCFIERRRLGLNSWCKPLCCNSTPKCETSCAYCPSGLVRKHKVPTFRSSHAPSSTMFYPTKKKVFIPRAERHKRSSSTMFIPTKHKIFIPRSERSKRSPFRRPRSRARRGTPSPARTMRKYYRSPSPYPYYQSPRRQDSINITNFVDSSSCHNPSLHKRWTEGMLFRKPRRPLRPKSMGWDRYR